jgi:hypothetical protein
VSNASAKNLLTACLIGGWLLAAGWGMWKLATYAAVPGVSGAAPADWPASSALLRAPGHFTAVIALHPECPCSQATVEELDSIMAQSAGRLRVHVLFIELAGLPESADRSELWARTQRIAGVELHKDSAGEEAHRFGTRTSGETRLYDPDGRLVFRGGITIARGHVGENPGQAAVLSLLARKATAGPPIVTPVFGCALWNETAAPGS